MVGGGSNKRRIDKEYTLDSHSDNSEDEVHKYHDRLTRKKRKEDRQNSVDEQEEKDIFHLSSHPIRLSGDNLENNDDDKFTLFAHEADLSTVERGQSKNDQDDTIIWNGTNIDKELISIKTDRYDILHLIDTLPQGSTLIQNEDSVRVVNSTLSRSSSPNVIGMSDLESDSEDVFFLSYSEAKSVRNEKHKNKLDMMRKERMQQAGLQEEGDQEDKKDTLDLLNNDQISQDQFNLMKKTSEALRKASNRSILESRILVNHGNDPRFGFLNDHENQSDRIKRTWKAMMEGEEIDFALANEPINNDQQQRKSNNTLVAYDSSEEEIEEKEEEDPEAKRKRKLALAQEWIRKRRQEMTK